MRVKCLSLHLGSSLAGLDLGQTGKASLGLLTHDTTTEVALDLKVLEDGKYGKSYLIEALRVVGVDGLDKLVQGSLVLLVHIGEGKGSGGLLVDDSAKTSLALKQ